MHVNPTPRFHLERSQRLRVSDEWTRVIHEGYPPSRRDPEVVVVLDPCSPYNGEPRWGFARREPGWFPNGAGGLSTVTYLHLFCYWQAPGDSFKHPSSLMAAWLRDHDTRSRGYCGTWDDTMFGDPEEENARLMAEMEEGYRELLDAHGRPFKRQTLKPRLSNKYFGGHL